MKYTFKLPCDEPSCNDGTMDYDRDGFDGPYAVQHTCWECNGQGWSQTFEDRYNSISDLLVDYAKLGAYDIEPDTGQYNLDVPNFLKRRGFTHARLK